MTSNYYENMESITVITVITGALLDTIYGNLLLFRSYLVHQLAGKVI